MKKPADDRYDVNMRQFCRQHEEAMERALAGGGASRALLERHLEKLHWLQHERLIHLIVLAMTVVGELFFLFLSLTCQTANPAAAALALLLAVLLVFYFRHYFFSGKHDAALVPPRGAHHASAGQRRKIILLFHKKQKLFME